MFRLSVITLLLLFTPFSFAEHYYWAGNVNDDRYSNPNDRCNMLFKPYIATANKHPDIHQFVFIASKPVTYYGDVAWFCSAKLLNFVVPSNEEDLNFVFKRYGDSCPTDKIYNANTGLCISANRKTDEQCAALNGTSFPFSQQFYPFCHEGCRALSMISICGEPYCNQLAAYTGGACDPDDEDLDNDPANVNAGNGDEGNGDNGSGTGEDHSPEPDTSEESNDPDLWDQCPKGYIKAHNLCVAVPDSAGKCPKGYYKPPDFNYCNKKSDSTSGGNNGGDSGSNNGNGGSNNGSDNGSGNSGNGENGGNGNNGGGNEGGGSGSGSGTGSGGSGSGTGNGDGKGECKDGEDCNGKASEVGGESCDADLTCEGDAIQCALLKQQKQQTCRLENDYKHHRQLYSENAAQEAADKAAFEENSTELPIGNLFNEAKNASGWLPKSCPAPRTVTVAGRALSFDFSPFCQFATWLAPIIVLVASLIFLFTVGKAVKG